MVLYNEWPTYNSSVLMWLGLQFELKVLRSISILGSNLTLNCFDGVRCRHTC